MPQSPHRLRNDLKCVEWDVKPYTTNLFVPSKKWGPFLVIVATPTPAFRGIVSSVFFLNSATKNLDFHQGVTPCMVSPRAFRPPLYPFSSLVMPLVTVKLGDLLSLQRCCAFTVRYDIKYIACLACLELTGCDLFCTRDQNRKVITKKRKLIMAK